MEPRAFQVTFDAHDPAALSRFWAEALGYELDPPPEGYDSWPDFLRARGVPEEEWNSASALHDPSGAGPRLFFRGSRSPRSRRTASTSTSGPPAASAATSAWPPSSRSAHA